MATNASAPRDDRALLAACLSRDEDAWKEFLDRHSRILYGAILAAFRRRGIRPTVEQSEEAFCGFMEHLVAGDFRALRSFDGRNGCALSSWLRVLTVNHTLDRLRGREGAAAHREVPLADALAQDWSAAGASPEIQLDEKETRRALERCFSSLSAKEQLLVRLYYRDGVPVAQIAKLLRLTESGVYALKGRVAEKIREKIGR